LREAKGDLELEDLNQVPYLRLTPQLINCLDFPSFEDKVNNNTWLFILLCMCVCNNFYNGPDFYTGPLLSN
jgi:hypothetical protein